MQPRLVKVSNISYLEVTHIWSKKKKKKFSFCKEVNFVCGIVVHYFYNWNYWTLHMKQKQKT